MKHMGLILPGLTLALTILPLAAAPGFAQSPAAANCEALLDHALSHGTITTAEFVPAGGFSSPDGRDGDGDSFAQLDAFCRVAATLSPVSGSRIGIEVWLPAADWNNKLAAVGNGGLAGSVSHGGLAGVVEDGYAGVSTDTGHSGGEPGFFLEPEKLTDFAHRAVHEMTVAAKDLVAAYYAVDPRYTYFNGCSTGGRQALTAAQRYPGDFDGIVAGAPANSTVRMTTQQLWTSRAVVDEPGAALSAAELADLNAAVIAACDAIDGVGDGVIEDPSACTAGPDVLETLTAAQREAVRKIYSGPVNPETGERIFPGLARGSELGWTSMAAADPFGYADNNQRYVIYQDPDWNYETLDFSRDLAPIDERMNALGMQAVDPDLADFFAGGAKLLMYHGWNDPLISPFNSVGYYTNVLAATGADSADSIRLFMMPGVNHCRGGNGTDTWDPLAVLDAWRESGNAPERIEAARFNEGVADRTRPLCAWPETAVYDGSGSTDEAANFRCE